MLLITMSSAIAITELNPAWFGGLTNNTIQNAFPSAMTTQSFIRNPVSMGYVVEYPTVYVTDETENLRVWYDSYNVSLTIPTVVVRHCLNNYGLMTCSSVLYNGNGYTYYNNTIPYNVSGEIYSVVPIHWQNMTYAVAEFQETLYLRDYVAQWLVNNNTLNESSELFG